MLGLGNVVIFYNNLVNRSAFSELLNSLGLDIILHINLVIQLPFNVYNNSLARLLFLKEILPFYSYENYWMMEKNWLNPELLFLPSLKGLLEWYFLSVFNPFCIHVGRFIFALYSLKLTFSLSDNRTKVISELIVTSLYSNVFGNSTPNKSLISWWLATY